MAKDHSFDIVSKVDMQEVRNAIQMAQKEVGTRFDFRGTSASVVLEGSPGVLKVTADHEAQLKSVIDVFETRLAKRGVSVRAFSWSEPEHLPSGNMKQQATLQQGLDSDKAKAISKTIKGLGLKVQPRIEGEMVRVSGRQLDDLQTVISTIQEKNFGVPLQVENYR